MIMLTAAAHHHLQLVCFEGEESRHRQQCLVAESSQHSLVMVALHQSPTLFCVKTTHGCYTSATPPV